MERGHEVRVLPPSQAIDLQHATSFDAACLAGQWHGLRWSVHPRSETHIKEDWQMRSIFRKLWRDEEAQDIAEYAVMLAVILVIVVGTIRLIGANANNVFSSVASSIAQ
jgi:Flp pilus assembly pilin Flp